MSEASSREPTPQSEKAQRLRVRFSRGPEALDIGHLDLARVWERALSEAGLALSYSQSKNRQPRITLAAGLPAAATSDGELLDVILAERTDPSRAVEAVLPHLPPGIRALEAWEVGMGLPSLPSLVRWADYEVDVPCADGRAAAVAIESFLATGSLHWIDTRGEKTREYDLRALVQELRVCAAGDGIVRLSMRLRCDAAGVGRPDQVVKALGLPQAARVHRKSLVLAETSPARDAWRRRGQFLA